MNTDVAERVRELLVADAAASCGRFGNAVTTGFWSMTGREVPVVVHEAKLPGTVRLSDAGEAWYELVSEGFSDPSPSTRDRERIERLCEFYGVKWEPRSREIFVECPLAESPAFARKVLAATIALDGWRALHPVDKAANRLSRQEIVDNVVDVARQKGIEIEPNASVLGRSGHAWSADAVFRRGSEHVVGVHVLEENVPAFTDRAIGWSYDTGAPLVVVASPQKVERIRKMGDLRWKAPVRAIARDVDHLAEQVVGEVARELAA